MSRKILLDMDGVIVDFHKGVQELFKIEKEFKKEELPLPWDWILTKTKTTEDEFWSKIDTSFWENLDFTQEGRELLTLIECYFDQICLLTNPSGFDSAISGKIRWLDKNLPRYKNKVLFGSEKHFCAHEYAILIDDSEGNCNTFEIHNGKTILVPRPWNKNYSIPDPVGYVEREISRLIKK